MNGLIFWTLHDQWPFCGAEHYTHPPINEDGLKVDDFRYRENIPMKVGCLTKKVLI